MAEDSSKSSNRKIILIGAVAALGWLAAIYFGVNSSRTEQELTGRIAALEVTLGSQEQAAGTLEEMQTQIDGLRPQLEDLDSRSTPI